MFPDNDTPAQTIPGNQPTTTEQAIYLKRILEDEITALAQRFEAQTGLIVKYSWTERETPFDGESTIKRIHISAEVRS